MIAQISITDRWIIHSIVLKKVFNRTLFRPEPFGQFCLNRRLFITFANIKTIEISSAVENEIEDENEKKSLFKRL